MALLQHAEYSSNDGASSLAANVAAQEVKGFQFLLKKFKGDEITIIKNGSSHAVLQVHNDTRLCKNIGRCRPHTFHNAVVCFLRKAKAA
jgi:hypothetical protein